LYRRHLAGVLALKGSPLPKPPICNAVEAPRNLALFECK
jgi:hypothetical protein